LAIQAFLFHDINIKQLRSYDKEEETEEETEETGEVGKTHEK